MAYRGLTIIFASFLLFLGQCGYSNGQCAQGECTATDLGTPQYLQRDPDGNAQGCYSDTASVTLSCETGTLLDGPSENTCNSGNWMNGTTTCTAFNCSAPSSMDDNLDWTDKGNETYRGDQTIQYSCPEGFKLEGSETNICIDQDEWANADPTCNSAFNCSAPSSMDDNLEWTDKGNETYKGDQTIQFSCAEGFKLEGSETNTCIDQDEWENEDPTCSAFNCSAPSSMDDNLDWTDKGNETYKGDQTIQYSCAEGFKLEGSETNTCMDQDKWENVDPTCNSGNVVQVFWYFFLMTTFYSIFSFYM